jgi:hypothetical protein
MEHINHYLTLDLAFLVQNNFIANTMPLLNQLWIHLKIALLDIIVLHQQLIHYHVQLVHFQKRQTLDHNQIVKNAPLDNTVME